MLQYIVELAISFLPYLIGINLLCLIIAFAKFQKFLKNRAFFSAVRFKGPLRGVLLLGFGVLFIRQSNIFNSFYNSTPEIQNLDSVGRIQNSSGIKVLYGNIHKNNTNYSGIQDMIEKTNPDLILFVEFSENHYEHLKEFLKKNYPYINSTTRSKKFIGSMVFSKYKVENRADDFPQGRRRYAYFSLQSKDGPEQYFYLVHTSSPDSYAHFKIRNEQLTSFINDFQSHQRGYRADQDKVFIVGDFNMTPWSMYYKNFESGLGNTLINATKTFPIAFTRYFFPLPIFRAHIDHLWTNDIDTIHDLKTIKIPGSDHRGFTFTITN